MTARRKSQRWWLRTVPLFVTLVLVAGACSGGDDSGPASDQRSDGTSVATSVAPDSPAPGGSAGETPPDDLGSGGVDPIVYQQANFGRDIIFRADLTIAVSDVAAAGAAASAIVQSVGGFLYGQQTTGGPNPMSILTFKVLPDRFQETLAKLGTVGEIRSQNVSAEDVTERVVDLQSRISTAEASVERLRGFLEKATDIKTITDLESQLLQRETDLETLRGQLRTVQDQVDLATIVVTLTEALSSPGFTLDVSAYPGHEDAGASCPGDAGLTVDEGDDATVCFEVTNTGDTSLTGFTLADPVLDVTLADLIVVFGDPSGTLEPGQAFVVAAEITVERNTRTQTKVTATPVDEEGNSLVGRTVSQTETMFIVAADPGGIPGFTDGLTASWSVLKSIGAAMVLVTGALVPFLWILAMAGGYIMWRRRRAGTPRPTDPGQGFGEAPGSV